MGAFRAAAERGHREYANAPAGAIEYANGVRRGGWIRVFAGRFVYSLMALALPRSLGQDGLGRRLLALETGRSWEEASAQERERLMRFYKRRGAKGLLVPGGPELVTNGTFDADTDWIKSGSAAITGGLGIVANGAAGSLSSSISFVGGRNYALDFSTSYTSGRMEIDIATAAGARVTYVSLPPLTGTYSLIFAATGNADRIRFISKDSAAPIVTIDNISIRELRPEEEW